MPNDNMGDSRNITDETFKKAAEASGQTLEDAKKNVLEMLKKQVGEKT